MDVPPEVRRTFARRITVGGLKLKVELLPAVWLKAPFTGIMISSVSEGTVSLKIDRPYARATKADYARLLRRIRVVACSRPACRRRCLLGDQSAETNPLGLCRRHWLADLEEQGKREAAEQQAQDARDDATAKARGMLYKAWVWIHRDGDDYAVVRYFPARPNKETLRRVARARRSMIVEDFQVERL